MKTIVAAGVIAAVAGLAVATQPPVLVSRAGAGRQLSLTVYNVGRALVRDARPVTLPEGRVALEFRDIAARVMPETVAIEAAGVRVLEQNYEYDLLSPQTLLAKYLGHDVTLLLDEPGPAPGEVVRKVQTGRLLSIEGGTVWRFGDVIVTNPPYRQLQFSDLPESLRDQPTLVWQLDTDKAGERRIEATYLTGGMSWEADYVLTLDGAGELGQLLGWVTLNNESGAAYPDATLQLVAGDIHLAPAVPARQELMVARSAMKAGADMQEESFADYHLYTLERPTTIKERQKKQVSLLAADGVRIVRHYRVESPQWWFQSKIGKQKQDVAIQVELANRADNRLGMPLPAGVVRLYQRDRRGTAQFIGEDRIQHTANGEIVTLKVGTAFDIVAERRQTEYRRIADNVHESAFEVTLRNRKDVPITVEVREQIGGDWEMLQYSQEFEKVSAFGVEFKVPVAADGEVKLTYRVRVRW